MFVSISYFTLLVHQSSIQTSYIAVLQCLYLYYHFFPFLLNVCIIDYIDNVYSIVFRVSHYVFYA
jgi:hypothetical protein